MTYEEIYASYREKVLAYLLYQTGTREDAEDVCEDVFEQIGNSLARYDAQKSSLSTWIYTITRFTLIDHMRTKRPAEPLDAALGSDEDPDASLIRAETLETLAAALKTLDGELARIILLRYYEKKTLTEISRITGISYGMVRVKHNRALALLRAKLE